ncbi:MAG: MarR family transcriptional regulator [Candidatus Heimdallarchaeota archaeon]
MLSDVLNYLKKGGEARISTIARKLEMEKGTVEMLMDQLIKLGYLEVIQQDDTLMEDACTPIKCKGCAKNTNCSTLINVKYKLLKK